MKKIVLLAASALLCGLTTGCANAATPLYGDHIVLPPAPGAMLKAGAADLADALAKMTGHQFAIDSKPAADSITCVLTTSPAAPADAAAKLKGKGGDSFAIRSTGAGNLTIVANREPGLSHGIYYYLEQLGVRYYFPNDNWTIVPKRDDIGLKIDRVVEPAFKVRTFFGTGGFGPGVPVDPTRKMEERWDTWQRRNRFGGEFALGGHAGETFNLDNKAVLETHPEYLAKVAGKYTPWSETAKLNTASPAAVQLFIDDRLRAYRQQRATAPDAPASFAVTVDPADGSGYCDSEECKKIGNGSTSDQVFYVANQVAKAVAKEFPDGHVNLYAYAAHAAVPSFPLEKNVYVQVIPYAFQDTGLSAEEFIKAWGKKVTGMSIYDYWSIPDWNKDLPSFGYLTEPREKIRLWAANGINGFTGESTHSGGAMGLAWYITGRLMWDPQADDKAMAEEFYRTAFGPAAPPMKRMMERWEGGFRFMRNELALSFQDMQEAQKLAAGAPAVRARVDDFAMYLQYLRLQYENTMPGTPEEKQKIKMDLIHYMWSINDTAMIHTFRLFQFAVDYGRDAEATAAYSTVKKDAPGWQGMHLPTHEEVAAFVADGARDYKPLDFVFQKFKGDLAMVDTPDAAPAAAAVGYSPKAIFTRSLTMKAMPTARQKEFHLKLGVHKLATITVKDENGALVWKKDLETGTPWFTQPDDVTIPFPQAGLYTILIANQQGSLALQTRNDERIAMTNFLADRGEETARLYFYVPRGTKFVAYNAPGPTFPNVYDPAGTLVKPTEIQDGGKTMIIAVPAEQDGKAWSLGDLCTPNGPIQMLTVPGWFSLNPQTLLVPDDALN